MQINFIFLFIYKISNISNIENFKNKINNFIIPRIYSQHEFVLIFETKKILN